VAISRMNQEYAHYLETPHWKTLAESVKEQRPACEDCGLRRLWAKWLYGQDLNVHHPPSAYSRLGAEELSDLVVLCAACHAKRHGLPKPGLFQRFARWSDPWKMPDVRFEYKLCANCGKAGPERVYDQRDLEVDYLCDECLAG